MKRPSAVDLFREEEIDDISPLMSFVCREKSAKLVFDTMDVYVDWLKVQTGEFEKNVPFLTVVGTPGKGKTAFSRRFIDLPYFGRFPDVVEDCKESNRSYRVSCPAFHPDKDPETQLSLLVLFESI